MKFPEFVALVEGWAKERKIIPNATPTAQLLKAASEVGELADGVNKRDIDAIKDAIGDVAVCLVNFAALRGVNVYTLEEVMDGYDAKTDSNQASIVFGLMDAIAEMGHVRGCGEIKTEILLEYCIDALSWAAKNEGLDFMDCCESAWNEIKDRKGELRADGVFVKESELNKE